MTTITYNSSTDFVAALEDFASNFLSDYWGFFSDSASDFIGRELSDENSQLRTLMLTPSAGLVQPTPS